MPRIVLFCPEGEVRRGEASVSCWLNCYVTLGIVKSAVMIVTFTFVSLFPPTEQLPYLGGLYHQGRQTAVAAQVSVCLCAHTTHLYVSVCFIDKGNRNILQYV